MAEILRQVQSLLLTAASTMHLWRDLAFAVLAGIAIAGIWLYLEAADR